jgi:hypothetical protein
MKKAYPYIIVLLLVVIAGILILTKRPGDTAMTSTTQPVTTTSTVSPAVPIKPISTISVAGMTEYTDSSFGYSFWYPSNWTVTTPVNPPFGVQLQGVTVVATLGLQPAGQTYPSIQIKEARSTTRSITDTGGAGPIGPITFFFDPTTHLWMTTSNIETGSTDITKPANISINTMGGLHMFGGTSRFDTTIIPLSADDFVVVDDGGGANATALAKTVVATDPSVATPVSTAGQTTTIQAEKEAYATTH